jgi:hypothetical protein
MPVLDFSQKTAIRLAQLRTDGQAGREIEVAGPTVIGKTQGDITFPADTQMQPQHCRLNVEVGQLWAAPLDQAHVFFSLIGSYRLEPGDIIRVGNQMFEFRVNQAALEMGNVLGAGVGELSLLLKHPVAEFVSMAADQKHYSVLEGQTTWGRTKATYTFPTDTAMSRCHAKVYHRGEDFFIEDMGSTNGTFILVREETPIPQGSILLIGGQRLKVLRQSN